MTTVTKISSPSYIWVTAKMITVTEFQVNSNVFMNMEQFPPTLSCLMASENCVTKISLLRMSLESNPVKSEDSIKQNINHKEQVKQIMLRPKQIIIVLNNSTYPYLSQEKHTNFLI